MKWASAISLFFSFHKTVTIWTSTIFYDFQVALTLIDQLYFQFTKETTLNFYWLQFIDYDRKWLRTFRSPTIMPIVLEVKSKESKSSLIYASLIDLERFFEWLHSRHTIARSDCNESLTSALRAETWRMIVFQRWISVGFDRFLIEWIGFQDICNFRYMQHGGSFDFKRWGKKFDQR